MAWSWFASSACLLATSWISLSSTASSKASDFSLAAFLSLDTVVEEAVDGRDMACEGRLAVDILYLTLG